MTYRVLVVDDSKLARMSVAKALNNLYPAWERIEASNAEEALGAVKNSEIDVALLDFNMPGQDGLSLAEDLRRLRPDMPVAVVSANMQHEVVERAGKVGAAFLPKPLTQDSLAGFLDTAVQRLKTRAG